MNAAAELLVDTRSGVCSLTLNRPEARNALTPKMAHDLVEALRAAADDREVRAVVLTGAGPAFCAGGDVKAMSAGRDAGLSEQARAQALIQRASAARLLTEMEKPTIALIRGAAAGAGLSLALACDFRLACAGSKITTSFARVGLSGDYGISVQLARLVGLSRAKELLMLSPLLESEQALALGLLDRVWSADAFESEAWQFVETLAAGPTVAFGAMKRNIEYARYRSVEESIAFESANQASCTLTHDHQEAARAFTEKRKPVFSGR